VVPDEVAAPDRAGMLHLGACARYLGRKDLQLY
jgi:hypothetical protein